MAVVVRQTKRLVVAEARTARADAAAGDALVDVAKQVSSQVCTSITRGQN